jgi:hypothetical protein
LVCPERSQVCSVQISTAGPSLDATLSRKGRGKERGDRAMNKPDTPFPRHWLYYIALKILLIAGAIALVLKLYGMW